MSLVYNPVFREKVIPAVEKWHSSLGNRRGERAVLRRFAATPDNAFLVPEFHRGFLAEVYCDELGALSLSEKQGLARASVVLSWVRVLCVDSFPKLLRLSEKGSQEVRDIRFRRLLSIEDKGILAKDLCRMVRYLDGKGDALSIIQACLAWNDQTKRDWAEKYYA